VPKVSNIPPKTPERQERIACALLSTNDRANYDLGRHGMAMPTLPFWFTASSALPQFSRNFQIVAATQRSLRQGVGLR
jgi:hypothetical protein